MLYFTKLANVMKGIILVSIIAICFGIFEFCFLCCLIYFFVHKGFRFRSSVLFNFLWWFSHWFSHWNVAWSLFSIFGISHFLALNKTPPFAMTVLYGHTIECPYVNVMSHSWMLCSIYQQANICVINRRCPIKLKDEEAAMISQNRKWCHYVTRLLAKARASLEYKMTSAGAAMWLPDTESFFMELSTEKTKRHSYSVSILQSSLLAEWNRKISAVRSLADICFLHVLFGILIVLFN